MNEILKYTFVKDTLEVKDGELVLGDPVEITAYFTMKLSGMSLFETEYGKPLLKCISAIMEKMDKKTLQEVEEYSNGGEGISEVSVDRLISITEGLLDAKFVRALACATYTKINSGIPLNTIATAQEFKETDMYELCLSDFEFIGKLLTMAIECFRIKNSKNKPQGKRKN